MRQAATISVEAHRQAMKQCKPEMMEYDVDAVLIKSFMNQGSQQVAYSSIVAGGKNACVLHYVENNQPLNSGDLLLIDAGAEYQGYASDITRTFPINGRFSEPQKALYNVVLNAQLGAIDEVKIGNGWDAPHKAAVAIITQGLVNLGLLKGSVKKLIKKEKYKQFFMHGTGHWLGRDVHDVGRYKENGQWRKFCAGMVLTVEPGIYVAEDDSVDKQWWNIGIRIEDDVVVTESGCDVLTGALEKTVGAIEKLMK
jgi:Xaa-Pro aminopeptidase